MRKTQHELNHLPRIFWQHSHLPFLPSFCPPLFLIPSLYSYVLPYLISSVSSFSSSSFSQPSLLPHFFWDKVAVYRPDWLQIHNPACSELGAFRHVVLKLAWLDSLSISWRILNLKLSVVIRNPGTLKLNYVLQYLKCCNNSIKNKTNKIDELKTCDWHWSVKQLFLLHLTLTKKKRMSKYPSPVFEMASLTRPFISDLLLLKSKYHLLLLYSKVLRDSFPCPRSKWLWGKKLWTIMAW